MVQGPRFDLRPSASSARALVLSGGGARGAFQVGVWEVLARDPRGFGGLPEIVSGTSAGAINAYLLACGLGPEDMLGFWLGLAKDPPVVANERFFRSLTNSLVTLFLREPLRGPGRRLRELSILRSLVSKHALRRASGLEAALMEFFLTARFDSVSYLLESVETPFLFDASPLAERLRDATKGRKPNRTRLAINTVDAQTGSVIRFVNHAPEKRIGSSAAHYRVVQEITPEIILASASIPLLFNPVPVGGRSYWDGGLLVNTPLAPAIALGASRVVPVLVTPKRRELAPLDTAGNGLERLVDTFLENAYQIDRKLLLDRNALAARDPDLRVVALFHALRPQSGRTFDAGSYLYFEKSALLAMYDEGKRAAASWLASGPELDQRRSPALSRRRVAAERSSVWTRWLIEWSAGRTKREVSGRWPCDQPGRRAMMIRHEARRFAPVPGVRPPRCSPRSPQRRSGIAPVEPAYGGEKGSQVSESKRQNERFGAADEDEEGGGEADDREGQQGRRRGPEGQPRHGHTGEPHLVHALVVEARLREVAGPHREPRRVRASAARALRAVPR
jgi:predicted acylesterase/phospholipase RssA